MPDEKANNADSFKEDTQLELERFELEREKVKLERIKTWWTGTSTIVPLLIAAATIVYGVWSQARQARIQFDIQQQQARAEADRQIAEDRNQFELKAAEIVMSTESPLQALTKAQAMMKLFPDHLPKNFAASFDPDVYSSQEAKNSSPDTEKKPSSAGNPSSGLQARNSEDSGQKRRWRTKPRRP